MNDILAGHHDIYGTNVGTPGALGTYANSFWPYFEDREGLIDNIVAKLRISWYGQNYIGKYFMGLLPLLADTPVRRSRLIAALADVKRNDARLIVDGLSRLPLDWQQEIQESA